MRFRVHHMLCAMAVAATMLLALAKLQHKADRRLGPDTTLWAPGFTESAFLSVQPGMDRKQVYALLGKPLWASDEKDETIEGWTKAAGDGHYQYRAVTFADADRVAETTAEISLVPYRPNY